MSHNSAAPGDNITLTAEIDRYRLPLGPSSNAPAGIPVQFSVQGGSVIGTNNTDSSGRAYYTYTAASDVTLEARVVAGTYGGNDYVTSFDHEGLDVHSTTTSLSVNQSSTNVGSPVRLSSRLREGSTNLGGQTIHFMANGTEIGTNTTASNGWAYFTYNPSIYGTQNIQAIFYGYLEPDQGLLDLDWDYYRGSSSATQILNVYQPTTVTVDNVHNHAGQTVNLVARVNANGNPIGTVGNVIFRVNGSPAGTAPVVNGVATIPNWIIPSLTAGNYDITADFNVTGINYLNSTGTGILTVDPSADISVTKTVNNTRPNVGQTIRYIITVRNNGLDTATEVNILDQLPSGLTYIGSGWIDYFNIQNANVGVPNTVFHTMYAGGYGIYYIDALVNPSAAGHTMINYANKTAEDQYDPNTSNDNSSASIYVPAVDVFVNKWTIDGTTWNYLTEHYFLIDVGNRGPDDATNVVVVEHLDPGFEFISTPNVPGVWDTVARTVTWTFPTIAANSPIKWCDILVRVVDSNTTIGNTVTVTSNEFDVFQSNNTDSVTITVPPAANVDLAKEFRQNYDGSAITQANYHDVIWAIISAYNKGPDDATVTIEDIPEGFTPNGNYTVSYDNGLTWAGIDGSFVGGVWTIHIPAGFTYLLAIQGMVDQTGTVNNTANQTAQDIYHSEPFETVTASLTVPPAADIVVDKYTDDGTTWNYLTEHSFLIDVLNNGPDDATNVVVVETLQPGFEFVSATNGGIWDSVSRTVTWTFATLAAGQTEYCNILVRVTGSNTTIGNTVSATANEYEWVPDDNTDSVTITVPAAADVAVNKEFRTDYQNSTSTTTTANYLTPVWAMVHITNAGPDSAEGLQVTDILPAGLTYQNVYHVSHDGGLTWTALDNFSAGIWDIGTMLNGADYWLAILAQVDGHNTTVTNTATGTQTTYDQNTTNNGGNATLVIPPAADVYVNTSISKNNPTVGEEVVVRVKVGNNGPDTAQNVIATYKIPDGMEFVSLTQEAGYPAPVYDPATRTVTWNLGDLAVIDPWMDITLKAVSAGSTSSDASVTSDTYDPVPANNVEDVTITVEKAQVKAATVPMQNTGIPIAVLVLAVLAVFAGLVMPKRK